MRNWLKIAVGILAIALLVWIGVRISGLTIGALNTFTHEETGEPDPMFAEEMEMVTPPPESQPRGVSRFEDNSASWTQDVQTPVDKTVDELDNEARNSDNS